MDVNLEIIKHDIIELCYEDDKPVYSVYLVENASGLRDIIIYKNGKKAYVGRGYMSGEFQYKDIVEDIKKGKFKPEETDDGMYEELEVTFKFEFYKEGKSHYVKFIKNGEVRFLKGFDDFDEAEEFYRGLERSLEVL